jgi:branched-chain amino acid aminotransferase
MAMNGNHSISPARAEDAALIVEAVRRLIEELTARPAILPATAADACGRIIAGTAPGMILLARSAEKHLLPGVITVSLQEAIHQGGTFAVIQELWVDPQFRSDGIGAALVEAVKVHCWTAGIAAIEVGLPRYTFANLERTRSFYLRCGFNEIGPRMRLLRE